MKQPLKNKSSDKLVEQGVNIISELSDRGINFLQSVIDTYNKLRKDVTKVKQIIKDTKPKKEG